MVVGSACTLASTRLSAAPPARDSSPPATPHVVEPAPSPEEVSREVGQQLARQRLLLSMHHLRAEFTRDAEGAWFLVIENVKTGCRASKPLGIFHVLSRERIEALAYATTSLIEESRCGTLTPEPVSGPRLEPRLSPWVRPVGGAWAAISVAFWMNDDPKLPADLAHAPSALFFTGLGVGTVGGVATMLVPREQARPVLELSVASSLALSLAGLVHDPEPGVPAYGEVAAASGYALTAALLGVDAVWSAPRAMLQAPPGATAADVPQRALSPWVVYSPAILGGLISATRAFSPSLSGDKREIAASLAAVELVPASLGLLLGLLDRKRSEHEPYEPWLSGGPPGSVGMSAGGRF